MSPHPALPSAARPADRPAGAAQDIAWGRPVFRAPVLPSPRPVPVPLTVRSPFGGTRPAGGR